MAPNLRQTYMTPANVKTKVYFMWDFIGQGQEKETWGDVISRTEVAKMLLLDTRPGMLDMMVESTYPHHSGELPFAKRPVLGEDILAIAREL
ncbi:hypothetical protein Tdes44962_MAKER01208 [Teratosphaeria destructans]|uniref:Uncharacterized protein n=1 Tax=Teratosphaeria destructans TaxID=418781 RepID=A0A9W7T1X6_9PEZI|nr:hypothetical protein Tdes44962_MAKER01208 [Teratosphaeria destructans]